MKYFKIFVIYFIIFACLIIFFLIIAFYQENNQYSAIKHEIFWNIRYIIDYFWFYEYLLSQNCILSRKQSIFSDKTWNILKYSFFFWLFLIFIISFFSKLHFIKKLINILRFNMNYYIIFVKYFIIFDYLITFFLKIEFYQENN